MTLAEFIEGNMERLLEEWESFARTAEPASGGMTSRELRNWAHRLLVTIAESMKQEQSARHQELKSKGERPEHAPQLSRAAYAHAVERAEQGFTLPQMVSEYRALRASVVRLWTEGMGGADRDALNELVRFNEAIDQALTHSIDRYSEQLERARDLFVGSMSHDMRSPIATVMSAHELLLSSPEALADRQVKVVVVARNAAIRLRDMVNDLLDFARTRLGGMLPLTRQEMDLSEICRHVAEEFMNAEPNTPIRIECGTEVRGEWDLRRIEQLAANLISNACKYGQPGTPVTVKVEARADEAVLTVHNYGDPIPEDEWQRIFEPLQRGKNEESRPQSYGLGLYIACQIAEAHGGSIDVTSTADAGTTFTLKLPYRSASAKSRR